MSDDVTQRLAEMLDADTAAAESTGNTARSTRPEPTPATHHGVGGPGIQSGRGPTGRLRNFGAMGDAKFYREAALIRSENNDPEAIDAVNAEQARRES